MNTKDTKNNTLAATDIADEADLKRIWDLYTFTKLLRRSLQLCAPVHGHIDGVILSSAMNGLVEKKFDFVSVGARRPLEGNGNWEVMVNWSAIGSVAADVAFIHARMMTKAADAALSLELTIDQFSNQGIHGSWEDRELLEAFSDAVGVRTKLEGLERCHKVVRLLNAWRTVWNPESN